jgi:predicted RND superfamily exporter protein
LTGPGFASRLESVVFGNRRKILALFAIATVWMVWSATGLHIDAGFTKLLPLRHEYMQNFVKYQEEFGGANRLLIALRVREGDIFTAEYLETLRKVTDDVFFIPGVNRGQVSSLWTPNVRFTEVVEGGFAGGNVVPNDFAPTPEGIERVRRNVLKAGIVGRLVANDFTAAIVSAELLEVNPQTGERIDYFDVSNRLEEIRETYDADFAPDSHVDVHIIGFAKVIGDIGAGAKRVVPFFAIAFLVTGTLVYVYAGSFRLAALLVTCSFIAVVWQLGLLTVLGYGLDPMSILVPFLIFAIAVSHGVQMVGGWASTVLEGADALDASRQTFRRLLAPGSIALLTDTIGFLTILLIDIQVIREIAVAASLGVALIILTNLTLLPILLSYVTTGSEYRGRLGRRLVKFEPLWVFLAGVSRARPAATVTGLAVALLAIGLWKGGDVKIGDLHRGVPELRADSRYNVDSEVITRHFSIGVDILTVLAETAPQGCVDYETMTTIDDFMWRVQNEPGVQSVVGLPGVAKVLNAGWNEGSLKWRTLPRNESMLTQSVAYVPTGSGLLNGDCSVMPVMIFTTDHKAETIDRIVGTIKAFRAEHGTADLRFQLATGNVGVMAATNETVEAAQFPILLWVFGAVIVLCLVTFRSLRATLCIVLPLSLVSLLAYALMAFLEIGLKVSTLPVVALGVGIGVDYGIYIYARLREYMRSGAPLEDAYRHTLRITGAGVLCTGITLGTGVATWIFSPLKFQQDMGLLLLFLFIVNMLGALFLLPALARWLVGAKGIPEG